jgi:hypothetical protein
VISNYKTQLTKVSLRSDDASDEEAFAMMEQYKDNPKALIEIVAQENMGKEVLELVDAIINIKDEATIDQKLAALYKYAPPGYVFSQKKPIDNSNVAVSKIGSTEAVSGDNVFSTAAPVNTTVNHSSPVGLRACGYDCKMHILAGSAAAVAGGAIAYAFLKWVAPRSVKAIILIAGAIAAAVLVGVAKEIADLNSIGHTAELRDIWNTIAGGVGGAGLSYGLAQLVQTVVTKFGILQAKSPIYLVAVSIPVIIVIGYCPAKDLLSSGMRRC